jgi:hypothetical protein
LARSLWRCHAEIPACSAALVLLLSAGNTVGWIGGESGAYLRAPVGATAMALGGANSASPDYLASWWNPAILGMYRERHVSAGMGVRSLGRMEGSADISFRIPTRFGIGVCALYRGDPFLDELHDEYGELLDGGSFTTLTLKAAVGFRMNRAWSAGLSFGFYYQNLPTDYAVDGSLVRSSVTGIGGFTAALRYEHSPRWAASVLVRNIGLDMDWEFSAEEGGEVFAYSQGKDSPPPEFVLSSKYASKLLGKPFVWSSDLAGWVYDGDWKRLEHAQAAWHNGVEWRYWEAVHLRLGIGDLPLTSAFFNDAEYYWDTFTLRVSAGFSWELRQIREGLMVHYGITSDKAGALFDQALDITLTF